MTPMHQPTTTKVVNHCLTLDGTDVEVTRFVEHMYGVWFQNWDTLLNISSVKYDLGHDALAFTTNSVKTHLVKFMLKLSAEHPKLHIAYDYYTETEENFEEGTVYFFGGEIVDGETGLNINED